MTPYLYNIFIKIKMSDKSHSKGSIELVTGTYNATAVAEVMTLQHLVQAVLPL